MYKNLNINYVTEERLTSIINREQIKLKKIKICHLIEKW